MTTKMKSKSELESVIEQIRCDESPVGMDAVYVHAVILDRLSHIQSRLEGIEKRLENWDAMNRNEDGGSLV